MKLATSIALAVSLAGAALLCVAPVSAAPWEKREAITPAQAADGTWASLAQRAGLAEKGEDPFTDESGEPAGEKCELSGIVFGGFFGGAWGVDDGRTVRVHARGWELYRLNKTIPGVIVRLKGGVFLHAQKGEHGTRFIFAGITGDGGGVNLDEYFSGVGPKWSTFEAAVAKTETGKKATFSKEALTQMGVEEDAEGNPIVPENLKSATAKAEATKAAEAAEVKKAEKEKAAALKKEEEDKAAQEKKATEDAGGGGAGGGQLPASGNENKEGGPLPEWAKLAALVTGLILMIVGVVVLAKRKGDWGGHRPTPHAVQVRLRTAIVLIVLGLALCATLRVPALWATSATPEGPAAAQTGATAAGATSTAPTQAAEQPAVAGQPAIRGSRGEEPPKPPAPEEKSPWWWTVVAIAVAAVITAAITAFTDSPWAVGLGTILGGTLGYTAGNLSWEWALGGGAICLVAGFVAGIIANRELLPAPATPPPAPPDET